MPDYLVVDGDNFHALGFLAVELEPGKSELVFPVSNNEKLSKPNREAVLQYAEYRLSLVRQSSLAPGWPWCDVLVDSTGHDLTALPGFRPFARERRTIQRVFP